MVQCKAVDGITLHLTQWMVFPCIDLGQCSLKNHGKLLY